MRPLPLLLFTAACASAPAAATRSARGPEPLDPSALAAWDRRQPEHGVGHGYGSGDGNGNGNEDGAGDGNGNGNGVGNAQPRGHGPRAGAAPARVDVAFDGAPLGEALRFLADAAGVGIVLTDVPDVRVTLRLRAVDPRDALVALANAHGLGVTERGRAWAVAPVRGGASPRILPP